ncbi:1235_t:CDS:2 [Gigaspora margarita]|uniref:1235_t:CDS:1 n=1 Tax=Gigaspora margarita TaxID=4874 RepID=A0ABN7UQN5_GIGMA|nr:1235_t:CDS:2 [Gigaspora margarita]
MKNLRAFESSIRVKHVTVDLDLLIFINANFILEFALFLELSYHWLDLDIR